MSRGLLLDLPGLEARLARLDAKVAAAREQLGFDFGAAAAAPAGGGKGAGKPCGEGHIAAPLTCHKGRSEAPAAPAAAAEKSAAGPDYSPKASAERAKGGLQFSRYNSGGHPTFSYKFRDRDAAEHWYANDVARAETDIEIGTDNRRSKEWQADFAKGYEQQRRMLAESGDQELLEAVQSYASVGKSSRGGTATLVKIGAPAAAEESKAPARVIPSRLDPNSGPLKPKRIGATPKPKKSEEEMMTSAEVKTSADQIRFAKQQRAAAYRAGDKKGEKAWEELQRDVQRRRLAAAMAAKQQTQVGLFGATEYDESLPLFGRKDAADPVARLLSATFGESLPGAAVLNWDRHPRGVIAGRLAAEGLVYRFSCDSTSIAYRPAWDGLDESGWEARSEGFLMARSPGTRQDFRFEQKKSKKQCSKGYGCGSSCITLSKECRITPTSAISKQRLRQLQVLAKEGDARAEGLAKKVAEGRSQKAGELVEGRQIGKLKKMLEDPRVAEMIRTGKVPTAEAEEGGSLAGKVKVVAPGEILVDPERFQYKINSNASGEVGSLKGVRKWDDNLAGVISVWQDPADGKTYVVNGHNRLGLANRINAANEQGQTDQRVEGVTVRYLKAANAKEARAIGAMQNIAEGQGTEIDAAKFFRDTGIRDQKGVEEKGLPLSSGKAAKGLGLARLPDEMFREVVNGTLSPSRGAIIGNSGLDEAKQREIGKMLRSRKSVSDGTLQEYVEALAVSQRQKQGTLDIFGAGEETVDDGLARAELVNSIARKIAKEKRLFGMVSQSKAAATLAEKAGNVINKEESAGVASEADQLGRMFKDMKNVSGPISAAINAAAARVTAGEKREAVQRELYEAIVEAMQQELERFGLGPKKPSNEAPTASLFDSIFERIARLDAKAKASDPGQLDLFGGGGGGSGKGKAPSAAGGGGGKGQPCGESFISGSFTCRKGGSGALAGNPPMASGAERARELRQQREGRNAEAIAIRSPRGASERGADWAKEGHRKLIEQQLEEHKKELASLPEWRTTARQRAQAAIEKAERSLADLAGSDPAVGASVARVAAQEKAIKEVAAERQRQITKGSNPTEIPISEKDLEGMEQAKEIMAGRLSPKDELARMKAQGLLGTPPDPSTYRGAAAAAAPAAEKKFASPEDLDGRLAVDAHRGTSFDPEKRGRSHQEDFANHLNSVYEGMSGMATTPEQKAIFEQEMGAYRDGYKARYTAWLAAKSRIMSPMISGPARFPVSRMQRANATEHKRLQELLDYTKKGQQRLSRKLAEARDPSEVAAEDAAMTAKMISRSLGNIAAIDRGDEGFRGFDRRAFASNLAGRIARMANRGEVEAVQKALDQINVEQRSMKKPAFTPRHSIWELASDADQARRKAAQAPTGSTTQAEHKSGEIERDFDGNRVRIRFHDGKPSEALRRQLKSSGWKWSPTNSAWQRMNTENSLYSAKSILAAADAEKEKAARGDSLDALEARLDAFTDMPRIEAGARNMEGLRGSGGRMPTRAGLIKEERAQERYKINAHLKPKAPTGKGKPCGQSFIPVLSECHASRGPNQLGARLRAHFPGLEIKMEEKGGELRIHQLKARGPAPGLMDAIKRYAAGKGLKLAIRTAAEAA